MPKKVMLPAVKIGARNNASDKQTIQAIHDQACDLGADCKPMDMNEGITAMLNGKKINYKGLMDLGALEYARQEGWDIVSASQVLAQIAQMCQSEMAELIHLDQLSNIMRDLCDYIKAEVDEMNKAAEVAATEEANEAPDDDELSPNITATYQGDVLFKSTTTPAALYVAEKKLPDGDFLVVDKDGQHLQVKQNGKPDHRLMGAAWAALHGGYRGNKYEGSGKEEAISKLKALYKAEKMDFPSEGKSLNLAYVKSLGIQVPELAVKFIGKDTIQGYSHLWGSPQVTDLEVEYFTKKTNFWDDIIGKSPRPLTWDHAQGKGEPTEMKEADSPVIGNIVDFGDDEVGRWYTAVLDRSNKYMTAVTRLINQSKLGTSSDSAPQYVERVKTGKATWLKTWPFFAAALTDTPCEPRMIGSLELIKSLGITLPDAATWDAEAAMLDYYKLKIT